jgi:hypothetical protein
VIASASIEPAASGVRLATDPLTIMLQTAGTALPQQVAVRLQRADDAALTPCWAARPAPSAVTVAASDIHLRTASSIAVAVRADILGDRGFGTLEIQMVDAATKLASRWKPLSGTFARAPAVVQIACPADATAPCRLYGTELSAIDAVQDGSGTFVAPTAGCPPTDKGLACVYVPHVAHFELRLADGGMTETLSDGLIVAVPH